MMDRNSYHTLSDKHYFNKKTKNINMNIDENLIRIITDAGTIFQDKEVFTPDYQPPSIRFRDKQLQTMASHYTGIQEGIRPHNLFLKGTYATGKSSTVKTFFRVLEYMDKKIVTAHINCIKHNTEYKVIHKVYEEVFNTSLGIGSSTHQLFKKIMEELVGKDKTLVVCLDDFNNFSTNKELNTTMYNLLRANETYPGVRVSLITVSSKETDLLNLDPNVVTVYHPSVVDFPSYSREEVFEILFQRCELGFYPGVISDEVVRFVAGECFDRGDLRFGIMKLCEMGERAMLRGEGKVGFEDFYDMLL